MRKYIAIAVVYSLFASLQVLDAQVTVKDNLDLAKATPESAVSMLKGKVSGLYVTESDGSPEGEISTILRGFNSLKSSSQPLWVLNGIILTDDISKNLNAFWQRGGLTTKGDEIPDYTDCSYISATNDMGFLNPYDIESIEILKDLSATAIYGSAGANGVIIVNTRLPHNAQNNLVWSSDLTVGVPTAEQDVYKAGIGHNHTLSYRNSAHNTSFYVSAFYRDFTASLKDTGSKKGGLNISMESSGHPIFGFGLRSQLSVSQVNNASCASFFGSPSHTMLSRYPDMFPDNTLDGWLNDYHDGSLDYRALTSVWFNVNLAKYLSWKTTIGVDFRNNTRNLWYGEGTSFGKEVNGAASILSTALFTYNWKTEFTFDKYFKDTHHLVARLAAEGIGDKNKYSVMNGTSFDLPYLKDKGISTMGSRAMPYKFNDDYSRYAALASVEYSWNGFVASNVLCRTEFTPRHFKAPVIYPAANVMVDLRKIAFSSNTTISNLKLKGGFGAAGREEYFPYQILGDYLNEYPVAEKGTEMYYESVNRLYSTEWNVGVELGLFNRVNLGLKYYDKNTTDTFSVFNFGKVAGDYWISTPTGQTLIETVGSLANKGVEIDINAKIIAKKDWNWSVSANAAYNMNRIIDIPYQEMFGREIGSGSIFNINSPEFSVASLCGFDVDEMGNYMDKNGDGEISDADRVVLGNTQPKWFGGFESMLTYKDFAFEFSLDGAAGYQIANLNNMFEDGAEKLTAKYVEDGDFLRLSRISFIYNLPIDSKWVRNLKFKASATNLFTITNYSGWNPQVSCYGVGPQTHGIDYGSYPLMRGFVVGISANF